MKQKIKLVHNPEGFSLLINNQYIHYVTGYSIEYDQGSFLDMTIRISPPEEDIEIYYTDE